MKELSITAKTENLDEVLSFVNCELEKQNCSMMAQMELDIAIEELFVNIAHYAYRPKEGPVTIQIDFKEDMISVVFIDNGIPYNPWERKDPDITLSAEEREIGGLGVYMVKKSMDHVDYSYEEGKNILTIQKNIQDTLK